MSGLDVWGLVLRKPAVLAECRLVDCGLAVCWEVARNACFVRTGREAAVASKVTVKR